MAGNNIAGVVRVMVILAVDSKYEKVLPLWHSLKLCLIGCYHAYHYFPVLNVNYKLSAWFSCLIAVVWYQIGILE